MRLPSTLIVLSLLAVACTPAATYSDWESQIRSANEELFTKGNVAVARDLFASTYVVHGTGGESSAGPEAIEGFVTELRSAFPDLHVQIEILATQGDRVAWVRTHRGTHQRDFMGVPASGRTVTWQSMIVTRYEKGKIAEEWGVSDIGERLRVR